MIALLFLLIFLAMIFAWRDHWRTSYGLFAVTMLLSIYWLKYHATTPLSIVL
ncbi:MAG: DUF5993 family protein [Alphaproteobacteria bacterium]|nr:DUF5993 family protein [Alphaproteobacteria bacterium]